MKCKIGKTTVIVERGDITEAEVDAVWSLRRTPSGKGPWRSGRRC